MGTDRRNKTQRKTDKRRLNVKTGDKTCKNRKPVTEKKNYREYKFSKTEFMAVLLEGIFLLIVAGYFFYGSVKSVVFLSPVLIFYIKSRKKQKIEKKREKLREEFKETLIFIQECMEAGYSLENGFIESYSMMKERYGNKSDMVYELYVIKQGLKINLKIEDLLLDLAQRADVEDIRDFVVVFSQAKRGGGNLGFIMKRSIAIIREKMEIQKDIQIMLSGKKYENRIMNLVPIGIIGYISFTSKGFFDVMYGNLTGIVIMTLCVMAYVGAIYLAEHLMKIEV